MNGLPTVFEIDVAVVGSGVAMVCYGAQHDVAWLVGFGAIWAFGNFIKMLFKYDK